MSGRSCTSWRRMRSTGRSAAGSARAAELGLAGVGPVEQSADLFDHRQCIGGFPIVSLGGFHFHGVVDEVTLGWDQVAWLAAVDLGQESAGRIGTGRGLRV